MKVWPDLCDLLRDGQYWLVNELVEANFVFLDDIGMGFDKGFTLEKLYRVLNGRQNKWTVITSNLTLGELAKEVDPRIASRLLRGNSVIVEVDTTDFALRAED